MLKDFEVWGIKNNFFNIESVRSNCSFFGCLGACHLHHVNILFSFQLFYISEMLEPFRPSGSSKKMRIEILPSTRVFYNKHPARFRFF